MINTQLHNQLIDIEIQRKAVEAKKRVKEAKTEVLKERLKQALLIAAFLFVVLLMLEILMRFFPLKALHCPSIGGYSSASTQHIQKNDPQKDQNSHTDRNKIHSSDQKKLFSGTEYIKEKNYVYKKVYKDGELIQEERLAPTILESKKLKKEHIPQFSTLKKGEEKK